MRNFEKVLQILQNSLTDQLQYQGWIQIEPTNLRFNIYIMLNTYEKSPILLNLTQSVIFYSTLLLRFYSTKLHYCLDVTWHTLKTMTGPRKL